MTRTIFTISVLVTFSIAGHLVADERLTHRYISSHGHGGLGRVVLRGESQVRFVASPTPISEWVVEEEKGHWLIWCRNDVRDRKLYLSCPTKPSESLKTGESKAEAPVVFLNDVAEPNSRWTFEIERRQGSDMTILARVSDGEFKDWYLCVGKKSDNVIQANSGKKGFPATFVSLSREKAKE